MKLVGDEAPAVVTQWTFKRFIISADGKETEFNGNEYTKRKFIQILMSDGGT